jgi:hypothetical protein
MYLDPGSASLFVQSIFAAIAAGLALFGRSRMWFVALWHRTSGSLQKLLRRRKD